MIPFSIEDILKDNRGDTLKDNLIIKNVFDHFEKTEKNVDPFQKSSIMDPTFKAVC